MKNIKVNRKIKPICFTKREDVDLTKFKIGNIYYVCFGENIAEPCILENITDIDKGNFARLTIKLKKSCNMVYADEIGLTPEQAVINEVTF